jgi:hypothetical protein
LAVWAGAAFASPDAPTEKGVAEETFCLLIEPKDGPAVSKVIPGAKSTVLVPGRETGVGVRYCTAGEFRAMGLSWAAYQRKAEVVADRVFGSLKPEVTRDSKGFARLAVLRGKSHLTASTVLAPKFYATFRASMGDDLVVLIPDRFTIYVFPRPMGEYKEWGKRTLREFAEATYPVSFEVFLLNKSGLSALGSFQPE